MFARRKEKHVSSCDISEVTSPRRSGTLIRYAVTLCITVISAMTVQANAQAQNQQQESFDAFIAHTKTASFQDYVGHADIKPTELGEADHNLPASPSFKVRDSSAFEDMRQSILDRYYGVHVSKSFEANGQTYDCVPVMEQPAVRKYHLRQIATPPPFILPANPDRDVASAPPQDGASMPSCGSNAVPLMRVTLDTLSRFPTVEAFYKKAPPMAMTSSDAQSPNPDPAAGHKYAVFEQKVDNLGGNVTFNIWNPKVNTGMGQVFSLSQVWYVGGEEAGLQSEEAGWVVYPQMFGDTLPHYFIFSTADNYQQTGSYNDSKRDFVLVAGTAVLGRAFTDISAPGGPQHEFSTGYHRDTEGNWWVIFDGVAIGYYPAAFYQGGQNSHNATDIKFGTETTGRTSWPAAGSGNWGDALYGHAEYQRNLYYYNLADTATWSDFVLFRNSNCYHAVGPLRNGKGGNVPTNTPYPSWWTRFFFVGGPGGSSCS
ncbi:hypothetical protein QF000_000597 [Paraburkholderia atlantica]|uniref:neprosin family prolyl endopeptidase n=1 Tax=Paraburkholderia atlantica TaxID=2654982 RepID=UPI003D1F475A